MKFRARKKKYKKEQNQHPGYRMANILSSLYSIFLRLFYFPASCLPLRLTHGLRLLTVNEHNSVCIYIPRVG